MKPRPDFALLCQSFFSKRLIAQRQASAHTVSAYAQTFRLLVAYAQRRLRTPPSQLSLTQLDAPFIAEFLDDLETQRSNGARSRNARLASLRSFYHHAAFEVPQHARLIQRVLGIPYKRITRRLVCFLTRPELAALLNSVDQSTWVGRRNHALLLVAAQTGLRLSELTGLRQRDAVLSAGAHVRCEGKGRKERCTPLAKPTVRVLKAWLKEQGGTPRASCFRVAAAAGSARMPSSMRWPSRLLSPSWPAPPWPRSGCHPTYCVIPPQWSCFMPE